MKYQLSFDLGWVEQEKPVKGNKRPPDSVIFVAYLQQVAPQLITSNKPIHKTTNGYATNSSPWFNVGQFVFDTENSVIIHRHKVARYVENRYEYEIENTVHKIEFKDGEAIVH